MSQKEIDESLKKCYKLVQSEKRNDALGLLLEVYKQSKKIGYQHGIYDSSKGLMSCYSYLYDHKKVLEIANDVEKIAESSNNTEMLGIVHIHKGLAYLGSEFLDESLREFNKAIYYNKRMTDKNYGAFQLSNCYQNIAAVYEKKNKNDSVIFYLNKSISELKEINEDSKEKYKKHQNIIFTNMNIASFYMGICKPPRIDLAEKYINEILTYKDTEAFNSNKLIISGTLAHYYLLKKDFQTAILYAENVLALEKKSRNPDKRRDAYGTLNEIYGKLGNKDMELKYLKLYTAVNDSLTKTLRSDFSNSAKNITQSNDKKYSSNVRQIWIIAVSLISFILFLIIIFWLVHTERTKKKYEEIIKSFADHPSSSHLSEKEIKKEEADENETKIKDNNSKDIADSTVKEILFYLDRFEKMNEFTNKDINLSYLANYANTNSRYLTEVLKTHKGKTFSRYINGLRINYIMKLLYTDPKYREYKISYLAELCGFSSREVFSSAFKKETHITTTYYINQLKNDK